MDKSKELALTKTHERAANGFSEVAKTYAEMKIDSQEVAELAAADLGVVKAALKSLEEERKTLKAPVIESGRRIDALFNRLKAKYEVAEETLKKAINEWQVSERLRLEQERKAREAAMRAEQERIEAEARAAAELARAGGDEATAAEVEAAAEQTKAEVVAMTPTVQAAPQKLAGVSSREICKAEITDLMELVKAIAAGNASIELIQANTTEINRRARALKSEFTAPGIRVYSETSIAAAAR